MSNTFKYVDDVIRCVIDHLVMEDITVTINHEHQTTCVAYRGGVTLLHLTEVIDDKLVAEQLKRNRMSFVHNWLFSETYSADYEATVGSTISPKVHVFMVEA